MSDLASLLIAALLGFLIGWLDVIIKTLDGDVRVSK